MSQGSDTILAIKVQSAKGTPASGAGATLMEWRPSQGLQRAVATIDSGVVRRSGQKLKSRQGSISPDATYETELRVGNADIAFGGALGASAATASFTITQADVTSATISGTGTVITGASGSFLTLGFFAGMMARFTGMSTAGNNGVWFPILAVTASTLTVPTGYLADQAADTSFSLITAKYYKTPTPRIKAYYTVEEFLSTLTTPRSKLGTDMRFTNLNFNAQPNAPVLVGFGLAGRNMQALAGGSSPNFTTPTDPSASGMLVMLDGALYSNGVAALDVTGLTMGIAHQSVRTPLLMSRIANDVGLQMAAFTGQITGIVEDLSALDSSIAEDQISLLAVFADNEADPADFVSVYVGNCSYGADNIPLADGDNIHTATLYAGEDTRGAAVGYAPTTMLISTSAA